MTSDLYKNILHWEMQMPKYPCIGPHIRNKLQVSLWSGLDEQALFEKNHVQQCGNPGEKELNLSVP